MFSFFEQADFLTHFFKFWNQIACLFVSECSPVTFLSYLAALFKKNIERPAEIKRLPILFAFRQQIDSLRNFVCLANQMCEAGLSAFRVDRIVGRITVGIQMAVERFAEDMRGRPRGPQSNFRLTSLLPST